MSYTITTARHERETLTLFVNSARIAYLNVATIYRYTTYVVKTHMYLYSGYFYTIVTTPVLTELIKNVGVYHTLA